MYCSAPTCMCNTQICIHHSIVNRISPIVLITHKTNLKKKKETNSSNFGDNDKINKNAVSTTTKNKNAIIKFIVL